MTQPEPLGAVLALETELGATWPNIHSSLEATHARLAELEQALGDSTGEDATIVFMGSVGRYELTQGSDPDWMLLVDGQADHKYQESAFKAVGEIHRIFGTEPGREGVFGDVTFSHDLIQYIGGQNDTNSNLTHRILLLLESKPVGRRDAYDRVVRAVLRRYLSSDLGWQKGRTPLGVPRFLFNDIARYWRTMTVDYVYKQWTRNSAEWALKNAKLRMSRKLIYASGLVYCFSLADETIKPQAEIEPSRMLDAISRLAALTDRAPLDLLAEAFSSVPELAREARATFDAYDRFLELMGDAAFRQHMKKLKHEQADDDQQFNDVRQLGRAFQDGLNAVFIKHPETKFGRLTQEYGIF